MSDDSGLSARKKLSPEFYTRLKNADGSTRIGAIVIPYDSVRYRSSRQSAEQRRAAMDRARSSIHIVRTDIESVLRNFGGRQEAANAVGVINVSTTAAGLLAIADLRGVRAILENREIRKLPDVR